MRDNRIKEELIKLRKLFYKELEERPENFSEEYIRAGFINKVLELFGWNLSNTYEVIQEKVITNQTTRENLSSIESTHIKPDYQLLDRGVLKLYLDAKNVKANFLNDQSASFQIRSYGWSAGLDFSIISDFEHYRVYDTRIKPDFEMAPDYQTITFSIKELIDNFELYYQFLDREKIQNNDWNVSEFSIEIEEGYQKTLDSDFISLIHDLQMELAMGIRFYTPEIKLNNLQYFVQVIINRLLFHRVLEAINYEPEGRLLNWLENGEGFWKQFNASCKKEYFKKYDGAMYEFQIPSSIFIDDNHFEKFIRKLYGFTPYRFNAIEPEFIAEMYDYFLGKELYFNDDSIDIRNKKTSPTGSVPTPPEIAKYIVRNVIDIENIINEEDLLNCKVVDPCAGSGIFLVTTLDLLIMKMKEIQGLEILPYEKIKLIVKNCIYGVDIDPVAIEVLKMTLSLKLIMTQHNKPEPIERMLGEFSSNFQLGNSIVEPDIYDKYELPEIEEFEQIPMYYSEKFPEVMEMGGFSYVLTNPPYIEPKHFKSNWPVTYRYLRDKYLINEGKADISMFFLERVFELLRKDGKLGIIIQKRFFTTSYGKKMRDWLAEEKYLTGIKEYISNDLFKFKTTYVAVLFAMKKQNTQIKYSVSQEEVNKDRGNLHSVIAGNNFETKLSTNDLLQAPTWSYRYFRSAKILKDLVEKDNFFTINNSGRFKVTVGPQALDKQYYFLRNTKKRNGYVEGEISFNNPNSGIRENKIVKLEEELAKPIYENDNLNSFVNFERNQIKTYLIFPYDKDANLIKLEELKNNFPKSYTYLTWMDSMSTNQRRKDPDEFYGYTRNQNLKLIEKSKIFVPMTAKRVIASLSFGNIYGDNSNINAIVDEKYNDIDSLKALTVILNSEIFSLLAISVSGEARGGYYKMNKQFIGEVPIPKVTDSEIKFLSKIYDGVLSTIERYEDSYGDQKKFVFARLKKLQKEQNDFVYKKYNLNEDYIISLKHDIDLDSLNWIKEMRW